MKKCNNTKRSNLQKNKQNTSIKTLNSGLFHYSIQDVLASGIAAWFCTRCWRIIRSFSVSFGHFHFVVDDWIVSDWLKIWRNYYTQRYTVKMTCVKSRSLLRPEKPGYDVLLFGIHTWRLYCKENKKMAPISLKDPNIQAITEEFVKVMTGFKVVDILMVYKKCNVLYFWLKMIFVAFRNHQEILHFLRSLHCQIFGKWSIQP